MIKINEKFSMKKYTHGWELHETVAGKDKDGNDKDQVYVSYHPNLRWCLSSVIDKSAGECSELSEIIATIDKAVSDFIATGIKP